jgi:hypothetical protein
MTGHSWVADAGGNARLAAAAPMAKSEQHWLCWAIAASAMLPSWLWLRIGPDVEDVHVVSVLLRAWLLLLLFLLSGDAGGETFAAVCKPSWLLLDDDGPRQSCPDCKGLLSFTGSVGLLICPCEEAGADRAKRSVVWDLPLAAAFLARQLSAVCIQSKLACRSLVCSKADCQQWNTKQVRPYPSVG